MVNFVREKENYILLKHVNLILFMVLKEKEYYFQAQHITIIGEREKGLCVCGERFFGGSAGPVVIGDIVLIYW